MIIKIKEEDYSTVVDLFCNNIEKNKEYISHGEIQMGVADDQNNLSENYREIWYNYLNYHVCKDSHVFVYDDNNEILGFIISEISSDLDNYFGVICDVLTQKDVRCKGVGTLLVNNALDFFKQNNIDKIFIESGLNNDLAHNFFENIGFKCVSKVFMLN